MPTNERLVVQVDAIGNFSNVIGEVGKFRSQLQSLKLPDKLTAKLEKGFDNVESKVSHFQSLLSKGITTKGDFSKLVSSARSAETAINGLKDDIKSVGDKDIQIAVANSADIKKAEEELQKILNMEKQLSSFGTTKGKGSFGEKEVANMQKLANTSEGLRKRFNDVTKAIETGNIEQASAAIEKLIAHAQKYQAIAERNGKSTAKWDSTITWAQGAQSQIDGLINKATQARNAFEQIKLDKFSQMKGSVDGVANGFTKAANAAKQFMNAEVDAASHTARINEQVGHLRTQANYFFGLQNMGRLVARGIREAAESVRDLDKAMTETAVVTEKSVGDLWNDLPKYTKLANKLGATTQGAYETMTLYFQQGLNDQETFEIGEETMKMARIAGLDYAQTTNMMTAALRGFNMELNQTSAKRVNDVYSELAAITASDTRELGLAMERTASIAHSANMDFGNTTAFLAQMIETTREAPENLGTAMKTIIARFQELKQNPYEVSEVEGEEVDFNRVDKALKSIGVDLMDNRDKFRDLDDVFMDISSKWDGLSQTQQRYIATIAAGSRQQSRFLAMVQNYDRLKELTDAAANSEGAATVQFNKTLDSYEAKVNKLKNAWQAFTMSLANNKAVKGGVDLLQKIITFGNKIIEVFGKVGSHFGEIGKGIGEMVAAFGLGALGFKGLQFGANSGLGMLAKMTTGSKVGGNFFMGGGGSRADGMVAAKITNPIVNAVNRVTAAIQKQPLKNQAYQDAKSRSDLLKTRSGNIYDMMRQQRPFNAVAKSTIETLYGKNTPNLYTEKKGYEAFSANQVKKQMAGLTAAEQESIYKSSPFLRKALQRGYADAYKNLNLDKEGAEALNKHWKHMNQKIQSGEISTREGLRQLYNPALVAQDIKEMAPEASKQIRNELTKQIKSWSPEYHKKVTNRLRDLAVQKGLEGNEARAFVNDRQRYIAGLQMKNGEAQTSQLTKAEGAISKISMNANAAGQSVMGLGMALSSAGFTGAGAILMTVGNGIMGIGMAAEGATTAVSALGTAFNFLKGAGLLGPIGLAVAALGGVTAAMVKFGNDHKKALEKTRKDSRKVLKNYEDDITETTRNINKLSDSKDTYAQLSQGVDANNNNVSLGTAEYADYLQIINDIAKMHPELVKGYNAHGQAILNTNNAVEKAIELEQTRQQEAEKAFASEKSLDKLIAGRNTTKRWQAGQDLDSRTWNGYTYIDKHQDSKLKTDSQAVIDSIKKLSGGQKLLNDMAQQFGIDASDFNNLTDAGMKVIQEHGANMLDQVQSQLGDASDKTTRDLVKNVQDNIAKVGKDTEGIEAVTEPIYKSLSTFASQERLFDNVPDEFKDAAERGLKEISKLSVDEFGNQITGEAMQRMARDLGNNLSNLGGHADQYQKILDDVSQAQDDYVQNLNKEDYLNDDRIQAAVSNLQQWADEARAKGDETSLIIAETFENQLASIQNFTDEGAAILSEGFNTFGNIISAANGAFEDFQKQIEGGDFYTGSNAFKQVFDEIQDGIDNAGKGSQTWWKGAEKLLGEQNKNIQEGNFKAAEAQVKALEPMFAEGQKGADAFFDHVQSKQTETLDTMSGTVADLFKVTSEEVDLDLNNLSSEQFADLADKLGMSDQMLAAMLNKAKQFYDIDFSNVDVLREALATSESTVAGIGKTGDNTNLYTKESTFKAEAEAQNYTPTEIADLKKTLTEKGVKLVKDAKDIEKKDMQNYIEGMGIKTGEQFVDKFSKLGFSREDLQSLYKDYGNLEGMKSEDGQTFSQMYSDYLKTQETANLEPDAKAANELETTNSLLTGILAAVGGIQLGSGQTELDKVVGKEGVNDTAAQRFGAGLNTSGNKFANEQEYNTAKKALETEITNNQRIIDGLTARKSELHGSEKKAIEDEITAYKQANQVLEANLQEGEKKYEQIQKEKQAQDEKNQSKEKEKGTETTEDTTQADKALKTTENLQKIKDAQDALKTNGFNINEAFGLKDGQVSQASLQFGNIINTLKQSGVEVENLGSALQSLGPGGLEKINNADLGKIISGLNLTQEQADAINALNPDLHVTATADMSEAEEAEEEVDDLTSNPKEISIAATVVNTVGNAVNTVAQAAQQQAGQGSEQATRNLEVKYIATISNEGEVKAYLDSRISSIVKDAQSEKNLRLNASITVDYKKGKQAKASKSKATVDYTKGKQADADDKTANVNYKLGKQANPKDKTATVDYKLGSTPKIDTSKTISLSPKFTGTWEKKVKLIPSESKGRNNKISYSSLPSFGSMAKGVKYGRIGPKDKGGLTLTGEKGFEIAWLPKENKSMILGAKGPQMINLPKDAVVWTNEQSKKILKQKAISANSMAGGYTAKAHFSRNSSSGSSKSSSSKKSSSKKSSSKKSSSSKSSSSSSSSKTTIIIEYSGDVSVWWENQTRKVDATQRKVDSLLKKFEDELKRVGTTRKSIQSITNSYKKQLNRSIALNKTSKKVAEKGLYNLNYSTSSSKRTISYDVTEKTTKKDKKGKTTTSYNKKSKETKVSLSNYIKYDKTNDTYVIDQDAIDRVSKGYYYKDSKGNRKWAQGNASKGKAIKEAAEKEINDKLSKRNTAIDNITKAQEALKKINNDIYESFYRWEKSITRVYILSQKLEELTKRLSIAGSQVELQFAKLEAGINKSNGLTKIKEALANERELLLSQAKAQNTNVNAAKVAFQNSLNFSTYAKKYLNNLNSTEAKGDYLAAKKAFDLLDKLNFENGEFNYASAIAALNKKQYNEETNNKIKDVLDKIFEKQNDYLEAIDNAYQAQTEIYQKIEEIQSFIAEFEQDLLSGIEEQAEDQVRRLDKLNSALSKAFKDLIDEVKSRLDDRRRKEDNAKTESDIAKKQQRLAALRADTSGGHAVEIAQLEKEIAEAQQDYQRTLEDQLLERLQEQGDKAEKQRQRQIDLLELQNEIAKQTGSNLAEVKEWLKDPEANKEQIRQAWLANKNYDEATPGERTQLEQEFESEWAKYLAYNEQLPKYQNTVTSKMDKLESTLNSIAKNLLKVTGSRSARELRQAGLNAKQLRKLGYSAKSLKSGGYTAKELKNAGYSAKSIRKAGYSIQDFRKAGFSAKQAVKAGYSKEKTIKAYNYTAAKGMIDLNASGKTVQKAKGVSAKQIQKIINKNPKDDATQKDLAGVQVGKVDVNGKKKGGEIKDSHISATGKRVGANSGSYLYTANWDTNKGKITGGWTTWNLSEFTADLIKKYPIDASQALVYAIQNRKIGSYLNKNFKSLVSAAKISGKEYKLNDKSITGIIGANGYIYYNTSSGDVKRWDPAKGKLETITYDKAKFLKYAKQNNTYSKVYAQALIKKGAYTKSQLQKNGVKKFATGGLADSTGLAWLDGTPSKPELVLDAQDTKNFLTLRDVLDKAIGSTNAVENTYGGDTSYEININVDHINNDYDVDRIAERVEKKIIKNANYRNVVRVRNLR